ncbi:MAG TPA: ABC transporter permease [Anaerolineae bacterium]|nr:ABC transporter permease [Anaerolineae bacterium]
MHDRDALSESQLTGQPQAIPAPRDNPLRGLLRGNVRNLGLLTALALVLLILAIFSPTYMNIDNFIVVGLQVSYIGIAALGTAFLIISGNVDLSLGSIFGLCAAVAAYLSLSINPQLALLVGILLGGLLGLINGSMVWRVKISPIIITLGSLTIIYGLVLLLTGGYTIRGVPKDFGLIGQFRLFTVPTPVWVFLIFAVIAHFFLQTTTIGRHIFAIGGNREASEASGLRVRRLVLGVFMANGLIVGLAGVLAASRFGTASPTFGVGYELDVITAVILGGVAFTGGEGNIIGVVLAVILLGVLDSGLVALGVDPHYTYVVKGSALIIAVTLDQLAHERQEHFRTLLAMRERDRT